jgi:hypothetical protein
MKPQLIRIFILDLDVAIDTLNPIDHLIKKINRIVFHYRRYIMISTS